MNLISSARRHIIFPLALAESDALERIPTYGDVSDMRSSMTTKFGRQSNTIPLASRRSSQDRLLTIFKSRLKNNTFGVFAEDISVRWLHCSCYLADFVVQHHSARGHYMTPDPRGPMIYVYILLTSPHHAHFVDTKVGVFA